MITYCLIIFIAILIVSGFNYIFNPFNLSIFYILGATCLLTIGAFIIDLIVSTLVFLIPRKFFNPNKKLFKVYKFEKRLYEKMGIKLWKDYLPIGAGPIGIGFKKDKVQEPNNPDYIHKFLVESCLAEFMHAICPFTGFILLFFAPKQILLSICLPVCIVNFVLELLPFFVQRYNRPKLMVLYKRALKYHPTENNNHREEPKNT